MHTAFADLQGSGEPDPSKDTTISLSGRDVTVPQGKRIDMKQYSGSSFDKSEYLVYKESQHRIRYALKLKFPGQGWWH
jgi:poly [ADP-ribose] polymerase 2/3/4